MGAGGRWVIFEQVNVWRRLSGRRLRLYRCFRTQPEGKYCVQSADTITVPPKPSQLAYHDRQFYELLSEAAPDERQGLYATLEEAIRAHDETFGNED
jgi:hypothetical protein